MGVQGGGGREGEVDTPQVGFVDVCGGGEKEGEVDVLLEMVGLMLGFDGPPFLVIPLLPFLLDPLPPYPPAEPCGRRAPQRGSRQEAGRWAFVPVGFLGFL